MPDVPFPIRLVVLIVFLGAVAGIDRWRKGAAATKWREYGFLLVAATVGGLFAAGIDQISLSISPDYFELGKGIEPGEAFRWDVTQLGFQAGFFAGALGGGVLLIMNNPQPGCPQLGYRELIGQFPCVVGCALVCAVPGVMLWPSLAPDIGMPLSPEEAGGFNTVWGFHIGLYAGAALGLVWAAWRVKRKRCSAAALSAAAALAPPPAAHAAEPGPRPASPPPSSDLPESDR